MVLDVAVTSLVAVMSPGPDSLLVYRNLVQRGPRHAYACVAGVGLGLVLMCLLAYAGVGVCLERGPRLLGALQIGGALYLGYLGVRALRSCGGTQDACAARVRQSAWRSGGEGFASNVLNPKALMFTVAMTSHLFAELPAPEQRALAMGVMPVVAVSWFGFLVTVGRAAAVKRYLERMRPSIDRAAGVIFLLFAAGLGWSAYAAL